MASATIAVGQPTYRAKIGAVRIIEEVARESPGDLGSPRPLLSGAGAWMDTSNLKIGARESNGGKTADWHMIYCCVLFACV